MTELETGLETGLRDRLIDAGVQLASEGAAGVSLREIARRAGVSHGAPRRYFPTHLELLSAIARRGFADLAAELSEVIADGAQSPRVQLLALCRGYLDFAAANRGMYELMFRHDLLESHALGLRNVSLPLFRMVTALIAETRPHADVAPEVVAGALWANLHGIAQLWEWGSLQLATGLEDPDPLVRAALNAHLGPGR
jgi:AcrR family transcriptional regulator